MENTEQDGADQAGAAPDAASSDTLWEGRYALRDMNVIWLYTFLVWAAFVGLGVWVSMKWKPEWGWADEPVFWGILLALPIVLLLYQLCRAIYRRTMRYRLTAHRLYFRHGVLIVREDAMELIAIEDISSTQSLVQRFLCGGVGTVHVHSKDATDPVLPLKGLADFEEAFRAIDKARREERQRRGITII